MAYIENDGSEMAADLKRDFFGGGVIAIFLCALFLQWFEKLIRKSDRMPAICFVG